MVSQRQRYGLLLVAGSAAGYFQLAGRWWAAEPRENWPDDADLQLSINDAWAEPFGDRRQEIACIGQLLKKDELITQLDACLLSEAEMAQWETGQLELENPFIVSVEETEYA